MAVTTLSNLITMVKAEAGHALSASQGLNVLETLKHLIRRKEYELWTAYQWPHLTVRWDIAIEPGQIKYNYPAQLQFDQIRSAFYAIKGSRRWYPVEFGIPEEAYAPYGGNIISGNTIQYWDTDNSQDPPLIRVWPTPQAEGYLHLKGQKQLGPMCDDTDCCTLDPVLISLFVAVELLERAGSKDAQGKMQMAQRHLQKLLGNKVSAKMKVSTFGANRRAAVGLNPAARPYIDYIPM